MAMLQDASVHDNLWVLTGLCPQLILPWGTHKPLIQVQSHPLEHLAAFTLHVLVLAFGHKVSTFSSDPFANLLEFSAFLYCVPPPPIRTDRTSNTLHTIYQA